MGKIDDIWSSSRMMLPEHKARINQQYIELKNPPREKPVLDPQEWELINQAMICSLHEKESITLLIYDPYGNVPVEGIVERVDPSLRQVKLNGDWYKLQDIVGVE